MSTNPFVIDSNTQESSGGKYIQIYEEKDFIQGNCTLTTLELSSDNRYIQLEVTNPTGQIANKRMYLPKTKSEYVGEDKFMNAVKVFMGNVANLARRYKGEAYTASGANALEIAQKLIADVTPMMSMKKVAVSLELVESPDGKMYTNIGSFAPFADTTETLTVEPKQKLLLAKKLAQATAAVTPDTDAVTTMGDFTPPADGVGPF